MSGKGDLPTESGRERPVTETDATETDLPEDLAQRENRVPDADSTVNLSNDTATANDGEPDQATPEEVVQKENRVLDADLNMTPSNDSTTASKGEPDQAAPEEVAETATDTSNGSALDSPEENVGAPRAGDGDPAKGEKSNDDKVQSEIDESNAEDAEDSDNQQRHRITMLDYHAMSMENLVGELQRLIRTEKVQAIKKHADGIKYEFDQKFQEFIEQKKEDFIERGGNEIDFKYNSVTKRQFNEVYHDYREKRDQYYKNLEKSLKANLAERQRIIEDLKGLVNIEEDINTTYKNFKDLQEQWRNAGPVPRSDYNDVWRTYQHHVEIFYDFLHINRELRDLDFKHNLEEKQKIIAQAEILRDEADVNKAFRELQVLHKMWKEDIGPVGKEHRDTIWSQFSGITKDIHQKRQDQLDQLETRYEENLVRKQELIAEIDRLAANIADNHKGIQDQIKTMEELRGTFFAAGKVPQRVNEQTWSSFKQAVRKFNRKKNAFYKNLKRGQQENLDKKRELLALAVALQDSEDWDMATPEMKRIQNEWKKTGHVPRKYSEKIWKEFKAACNHYFDRLHNQKNSHRKEETDNLDQKNAILDSLRSFKLSGDHEQDVASLKGFINEWKGIGRVPYNRRNIDQKFNNILEALFKKAGIGKKEAELLKYGDKIRKLAENEDEDAIYRERSFIVRKIDESKSEIRQLENNLQFFSNASESSPLVQEVIKKVDDHKAALATWKAKLKRLNILGHSLNKEEDEVSDDSEE